MKPFYADFIKSGRMKKDGLKWCQLFDHETLTNFAMSITKGFPHGTLHCFAVKANPTTNFLKVLHEDFKFGMECASIGEVLQSLKICSPEYVVFDSPCKTREELFLCLKKGIYMNADNFEEVRRIEKLLDDNRDIDRTKVKIGVRINPIVGLGTEAQSSTATKNSKFGIPYSFLLDENEKIESWLLEKLKGGWNFVTGLHCHVGSVGMSRIQQVNGVNRLVHLAKLINSSVGEKRIVNIDIGGGLPTTSKPIFESYYKQLSDSINGLKEFKLITEFGRSTSAPSGVIISSVEYVKDTGEKLHVNVHCGANVFCRTAYSRRTCSDCGTPTKNMMEIQCVVCDENAHRILEDKNMEGKVMDIVGPLCFSGDIICKDQTIVPGVKEGDVVVFLDCGAYTLSVWSNYCSRPLPAVYLQKEGKVVMIKKPQSIEDCISVWD